MDQSWPPVCIPVRHRQNDSAFQARLPPQGVVPDLLAPVPRLAGMLRLLRRAYWLRPHGRVRATRARPSASCAVGFSFVAARRNCSTSGWPARASIKPRLRLDSNTSGLAATDLRYAEIESSLSPSAL